MGGGRASGHGNRNGTAAARPSRSACKGRRALWFWEITGYHATYSPELERPFYPQQQTRSPPWHSSTISALNSAVNALRRRGFFPMPSIIGHPSEADP
jgi:hypothetical protein